MIIKQLTKSYVQAIARSEIDHSRNPKGHEFLSDPIFDRVITDAKMSALIHELLNAGQQPGSGKIAGVQGNFMKFASEANVSHLLDGPIIVTKLRHNVLMSDAVIRGIVKLATTIIEEHHAKTGEAYSTEQQDQSRKT